MSADPGHQAESAPPVESLQTRGAWQRLHWSSIAFSVARQARALLIPAVFAIFAASQSDEGKWLIYGVMFGFIAIGFELLRYYTLRYRLTPDELIVRRGLLNRSERHVPFSRIQNIDLVQGVLHRLIDVAEVRIETASGSEPEATLRVITLDAVQQMRTRVFAGREGGAGAAAAQAHHPDGAVGETAPAGRTLLRLPTSELIRLGLASNRGMIVVAFALGTLQQFNFFESERMEQLWEQSTRLPDWMTASLWIWIALALAVLLLFRLFSIIWAVLRFGGYRLELFGDDLRIACGLLTRRSATVPRPRIQLISIHEPLLLRWMGRRSIRIETAGGVSGDNNDQEAIISRRWFVPIMPADRVDALLQDVRPGLSLATLTWQPLDPRGRRRLLFRATVIALVLTVVATLLWRPWGAAAGLIFLPLLWYHAWRSFDRTGYALLESGIAFRSGVWWRKVSLSFIDKVQAIETTQSPFDRRHHHATLAIDTAGAGPAGHRIEVPFLHEDNAQKLQHHFYAAAGQTEFQWA